MKPADSTNDNMNPDEESEGEEEVLTTWKATGKGKITVVANPIKPTKTLTAVTVTPRPSTTKTTKKVSSKKVSSKKVSSKKSRERAPAKKKNQDMAQQAPQPLQEEAPPAALIASKPLRAIWYLGGKHNIKLLTSVDGDLDDAILSKIAESEVPSVIGELALSVEALVSDDFTVGGFEEDMLAKIAANTLEAKRASFETIDSVLSSPSPVVAKLAIPAPITVEAPVVTISENSTVPNPLAAYQPVPNPLARITPPGSPIPKRKEATTIPSVPAAKRVRLTVPAPIKAQ